jgi:hypothetical protein
MASKTATGVVLEQAAGVQNVFVKDWKPNFAIDPKKKIACIPFMRNLIEYTKDAVDPDFLKLTSLLHWKADSGQVTIADLDAVFNRLFANNVASVDGTETIMSLVQKEAEKCLNAAEGINFENKIVLAMSIRLAAERFMVKRINDAAFVRAIDSNQTPKLLKKFCELFSSELATIKILQRVVLMTPENIHLNSFMYEPILDMSDEHLRKLYREVVALG